MPLQPGRRLGPYEILAPLGAGGMGEVYRARDAKLNRDVAIKILPGLFATDDDRLARFEREARVLASLNHPNIAAIYGFEDSTDVKALALELVEGQTLEQRIGSPGLPLDEALKYAIQIADALAAAHAAGVVHRDLKPGNVIVTPAGTAKVLDFGLAKLADLETAGTTMTAVAPPGLARTGAGMVLGTVAYMSPEQAAGRALDARSDIFSFGSVLFEMVTGRRPFEGDTSISTLAAIIHQPAGAVSQVNATLPRELERLISRCHRKDPAKRVQTMGDLRVALEELRDDLEAGRLSGAVPAAIDPPAVRRVPLLVVAAVLAAAGAGAAAATWLRPAPAAPALGTIHRVTADMGLADDPAVTTNGSLLAFASDRHDGTSLDIWVQPTGGGEPVRVTTSAADDREPAFSPDGSRIAFRSERDGGGIYLVPALGGPERLLVRDGRGPRFSPDGRWLSYWVGGRGAGSTTLFVMPADGGVSQPVHPDRVPFGDALWSPDGRHLMFAGSGPGQSGASPELWITRISERGESAGTPVSSGAADRLHGRITGPAGLVAWVGDRVYFRGRHGDGGSLWTLPVNREGRAAGNAELVLYGTTHIGGVAVDESGRVFFASQNARANIWTIEVDARGGVRGEPLALTRATASDHWPSLSADGRSLAFLSRRGGRDGLWVTDVATGASWSVAAGATRSAAISPDGRRIAYQTVEAPSSMFLVETAGGVPRQICEPCVGAIWGWTSDSRHVIANAPGEPRLVAIDAADGTVSRLAESASGRLWHPRPSPDGRWLAFIDWLDADRTRQVIAPFSPGSPPDESAWIHLTDGESVDEENAWSADGRTLYFVSERDGFRCVYALPLDPETGRALGEPVGLLHMHGARRSIVDTAARPARIDAGGGRLVFAVREVDGNIWSLTPH